LLQDKAGRAQISLHFLREAYGAASSADFAAMSGDNAALPSSVLHCAGTLNQCAETSRHIRLQCSKISSRDAKYRDYAAKCIDIEAWYVPVLRFKIALHLIPSTMQQNIFIYPVVAEDCGRISLRCSMISVYRPSV
jgi:hypothetical protein